MWAYEARRIFSDRLVGDKAHDKFESILSSVLQTDWSVDLASTPEASDSFYATWGQSPSTTDLALSFGRKLCRLASVDMEEMVAKAIISYGTDCLVYTMGIELTFLWLYAQVVNT